MKKMKDLNIEIINTMIETHQHMIISLKHIKEHIIEKQGD